MKFFEMPEKHICSCSEGRAYDKESEVCQKCVSAEKTLDTLFKKMLDKGSPDMVSGLLFAILLAKARKEKEEKEEDLENE